VSRDQCQRAWTTFLILLLATDLLFIGLHSLHVFSRFLPEMYFNITYDRGAAEPFQMAKEYWIALLMIWLAWSRFSVSYLSWAVVFGYIAFDDLIMVHEKLGERIAHEHGFSAMFGLRDIDFGEMTVYALAAAVLLPLLALAYARGDATFRRMSRRLVGFLVLFAFFGGVVDMVHILITHPTLNEIVGMVEDGGEMLTITATAGYVLREVLLAKVEPVATDAQLQH